MSTDFPHAITIS
ncbi:hypothetical protein YPPY06_0127, partial [Yersinia pestis PY-06]